MSAAHSPAEIGLDVVAAGGLVEMERELTRLSFRFFGVSCLLLPPAIRPPT